MKISSASSPHDRGTEPEFYPDTIRVVTLLTPSHGRLGRFYADVLGLVERSHGPGESVWCSPTSEDAGRVGVTLRLVEDPRARMRPPGTTGLFHTAFLLPDRPALAAATSALLGWTERDPAVNFQGYSEHGVSEAIYGTDPDGNGIELTLDHPFADWPRPVSPGDRVNMVSQPRSVRELLQQEAVSPVSSAFSHVHLNVRSLDTAEQLFVGEWGMRVMQRSYHGALFLAYGDYHHHIAANIWAGIGVVAPSPGTIGLLDMRVRTPDGGELLLAGTNLA